MPEPIVASRSSPGWYGKIPALGDFVSRHLQQSFITAWDAWLQHAMAASRAHLGERWLDCYLNSPIWRFLLMPGACGEQGWAGVLMPSVDKVGRHFPLTLALELPTEPLIPQAVLSAQAWFAAVEQLALSALDANFSMDQFGKNLAECQLPLPPTPHPAAEELANWWEDPSTSSPGTIEVPSLAALEEIASGAARKLFAANGYRNSLWWIGAEEPVRLRCFAGLPPEEYFAVLLQT